MSDATQQPEETDALAVPDVTPEPLADPPVDPARVELQDELDSIREVGEGRRGND